MQIKKRLTPDLSLNITPLVDVVFILLIFFMLTSSLLNEEAIELDLPQSSSGSAIEKKDIVIILNKAKKIYISGKEVLLSKVSNVIKDMLKESQNIVLKVDATVDIQAVIELMDKVKEGGGKNIAIITAKK